MNAEAIHVLIIEDSPEYAFVLQLILGREENPRFLVTHADCLEHGLARLEMNTFDIILLDLSLPDSDGLETFTRVSAYALHTPIVVLTALDDAELADTAVREGAQDYLIKGDLDRALLVRSLRYALERHRTMSRLQRLSMVDELTGLLNRRGFLEIARQHLKIAQRSQRPLVLFFIDLDGLKIINDQFGHRSGDQALRKVAAILRATFRSSDVLARLGGDEFTVLAINAEDGGDKMSARLRAHLSEHNLNNPAFPLSLSLGFSLYNPASKIQIEDLLDLADRQLYIEKREKQHARRN